MLKNKNQILISVGVIALLIILFALGQSNSSVKNRSANLSDNPQTSSPVNSESELSAPETLYDFGTIRMAAGKVSYPFGVKNESENPIQISRLYTSCMCTSASWKTNNKKMGPFGMPGHGFVPKLNQALNPNEEATIEVIFDPNAHGPAGVGPFERQIYLDGTDNNLLILQIKGTVTP